MPIVTTCCECGQEKPALRPIYLRNDFDGDLDSDTGIRICEACLRKSQKYRPCTYCGYTAGYRKEDLMPLTVKHRTYLYCPSCFEEVVREEQRRPIDEEKQQREQDEQDYLENLTKDW